MTAAFSVDLGAKVPLARARALGSSATIGDWSISPSFVGAGVLRFGITPGDGPLEQCLEARTT